MGRGASFETHGEQRVLSGENGAVKRAEAAEHRDACRAEVRFLQCGVALMPSVGFAWALPGKCAAPRESASFTWTAGERCAAEACTRRCPRYKLAADLPPARAG